MDLGKLADEGKDLLEKRGGVESVKEDAEEIRQIAGREESVSDKAKDAIEALKEPGAHEATGGDAAPEPPAAS